MGRGTVSMLVLDTHVVVWLLAGSDRLGSVSRQRIHDASQDDGLLVAAITPWEIAMLVAKGRLKLDRDVGEWLQAAMRLPGLRLAPLTPEIAVDSTRLPGSIHADPADRLIVATARRHGAVLVTEDALLLDYASAGYLETCRASV